MGTAAAPSRALSRRSPRTEAALEGLATVAAGLPIYLVFRRRSRAATNR